MIEKKLYIRVADQDRPYEGWCWPRESIWIDFYNPKAREYLKQLYNRVPDAI